MCSQYNATTGIRIILSDCLNRHNSHAFDAPCIHGLSAEGGASRFVKPSWNLIYCKEPGLIYPDSPTIESAYFQPKSIQKKNNKNPFQFSGHCALVNLQQTLAQTRTSSKMAKYLVSLPFGSPVKIVIFTDLFPRTFLLSATTHAIRFPAATPGAPSPDPNSEHRTSSPAI